MWFRLIVFLVCFAGCSPVPSKPHVDPPDMPDMPEDIPEIPDFPPDPDPSWQDVEIPDMPEDWEEGAQPEGPSEIHPGLGSSAFFPVYHGDSARWEMGFQGGYHVWVGVKLDSTLVQGLTPDEPDQISHRYLIQQGTRLLATLAMEGSFSEEDGDLTFYGGWAVFEPFDLDPFSMDGELLIYTVEVTLPDGQKLESRVWLRSECCDYF